MADHYAFDFVAAETICRLCHPGAVPRDAEQAVPGAIMQQLSSQVSALALAVALLAAPVATFGQTPAPSRDANVWDWRDHQPTQAEVVQKEKAAGIAASPSQRDSSAATVDQLYRQLLDRSHS
jgi:hypothetical protein